MKHLQLGDGGGLVLMVARPDALTDAEPDREQAISANVSNRIR